MSSTNLIIFDCDGVLVDSEPLAAAGYVNAFAKHGAVISPDVIGHCIGMKQADIIARVRELTGQSIPPGSEGDIWAETKILFGQSLQPTTGILDFFRAIEGMERCVASSSSLERINFSLGVTGLDRFFGNAIFSSSMVTRGKPAPDLFLHAAAVSGFDPAACLVIEDSAFGVTGAVAAGMTAIGFTGGSHTHDAHGDVLTAAGAHTICADWPSVIKVLRGYGVLGGSAGAGDNRT